MQNYIQNILLEQTEKNVNLNFYEVGKICSKYCNAIAPSSIKR